MANKPPIHVEPRDNGWAVVREGSERATSVHPTQSEAAKEGRELARRYETEFFLHAQDGRIREQRSYEEEPPPAPSEDKGLVDQAT
jgi:ketosteroid isomerase-like protein